MTELKRGDIVLVYYPLISTGLSERKLRPAVIIQCDKNNLRLNDVILIPLTSKTKEKLEETHTFISKNSPEGIKTGIRLDSVIKAETILTLPKSLISKKIGYLPSSVIKKVNKCLAFSIQLNINN
jgi:mRNA interferase MazF